jgi:outer membrane lipoprotein carrier protein
MAICLLAGFAGKASGNEESPLETGKRLQAKYNQIKSLAFDFNQQTSGQMTGRGSRGNGKAYFLKTGKISKMLWNYSAPEQQVILSDGTTLSMYFAKLKQLIITPADTLQ